MEKIRYQKLVKKHKPKENSLFNAMVAFFIGGIVGMIGQFLIDFYSSILNISTKEASTFMIVTLIFVGCFLTCLGFFDKWVHFAKAGLFIPITGFAHAMQSAALDYKKEGFVTGIGANMLKLSGAVIIFGIVSSYFFGLIRILFFGGVA
jgi:stage V sporulation protein AC